jgi:hypothetical protein
MTRPSPLAAGLRALRQFWRPFVLIQGAALALGLAYWLSAAVREVCAAIAAWRTAGGWPLTMVTGAAAGGLLPEVARALADRARGWRADRVPEVLFNTAFFAVNGLVIDGLYRNEARLFGDDAHPATIIAKTAFDQFVFTPLWLVVIVVLFLFRRRGFSWSATRTALRPGFYRRRVLPLLIPNFCFWIPIVSIVYALPGPLQFLMFAFALAAWSLIMIFVASDDDGSDSDADGDGQPEPAADAARVVPGVTNLS